MTQEQVKEFDKLLSTLVNEEDTEELVESLIGNVPTPLLTLVVRELTDHLESENPETAA